MSLPINKGRYSALDSPPNEDLLIKKVVILLNAVPIPPPAEKLIVPKSLPADKSS